MELEAADERLLRNLEEVTVALTRALGENLLDEVVKLLGEQAQYLRQITDRAGEDAGFKEAATPRLLEVQNVTQVNLRLARQGEQLADTIVRSAYKTGRYQAKI